MVDLKIIDKSFAKERDKLIKMAGYIKDLRPVWFKYIKFKQDVITPGAFDTQGKLMGRSWAGYKPSYIAQLKRTGQKFGRVSLRRSDTLYNAARGKSGWFQKVKKKTLQIGLTSPVYNAVHQYGYPKQGIPRRDYFLTTKDDITAREYKFLVLTAKEHITKDFKHG